MKRGLELIMHFLPDQPLLEAHPRSHNQRRREAVIFDYRNLLRTRQVDAFESDAREGLASLLERHLRISPNRCHHTLLEFRACRFWSWSGRLLSECRTDKRRSRHACQEMSAFHAPHYTSLFKISRLENLDVMVEVT